MANGPLPPDQLLAVLRQQAELQRMQQQRDEMARLQQQQLAAQQQQGQGSQLGGGGLDPTMLQGILGGNGVGTAASGGLTVGGEPAFGGIFGAGGEGSALGLSEVGGAGGAGGTGGSSSALAAAGPWAALAALIVANETQARKEGARSEDTTQYAKDLLGGKVLEQDIQKRFAPQLDKFDRKLGTNTGDTARMIGNLSTFDFSNAFKDFTSSLRNDPILRLFS